VADGSRRGDTLPVMPAHRAAALPCAATLALVAALALAPPATALGRAASRTPALGHAVLAQPAPGQLPPPLLGQQPLPGQPAPGQPPAPAPGPSGPATTTPFQTPDTTSCPYRVSPPAPVDLSEVPLPGSPAPGPLPVRDEAVGGARMAECGLVLPRPAPPLPDGLSAHAWVLADLDTGAVLAARDPHGRHRAASTIKILTALLAIRELDPALDVVGTDEDANQEGSRVGIGPGGHYTVDQLLHGLLMSSGNDAAHALAGQLGGVPATVRQLNELAGRLGALDTRVITPSGLDGAGACVSAYDLALIFRVAMREPAFAATTGSALYDFPGFQDKPGFMVANDNKLLANYPGALGGKTGFTDDARHTYAGAAQRNGRRLLVVLLRGEQQPVRMWQQAAHLLDYGFALPPTAQPVGTLVDAAPPEPPAANSGAPPAATPGIAPSAATGLPTRDRRLLFTALPLALAVLLAGTLLLRRRRTSRRRT
jgi:D-alanyl-D-alanine carboxypeptidase (penicillin-binding protein 5/6)